MTDELLALAERHGASPDKGRSFFVDLASKHLAVVRGLGFDGVYLGGHMPAETFGEIIDRAEAFGPTTGATFAREIQFPRPEEFHFFERDPETGLSSDVVNAAYLESKRQRRTELRVPVKYRLSRRLHDTVFASDAPLFATGRRVYRAHRARPRGPFGGPLMRSNRPPRCRCSACKDCGDCSLPEIAYVCPGVAVREEPAQRPVRRDARRPVRGVRHGVHLVRGVRAAQGVRRGGVDARRPGRRQGQRAGGHERLGEHVPRSRPPGAAGPSRGGPADVTAS